ncbi:MAG: hypothetical protein BZY88_14990 [SAR202 cluster bacterium Io17-Chloro-G9]|nr:MAG: hypothetical protein BZY88_14990 [SAR202 cluster bacterium Io17-Chloro-G9]
MGILGKLRRKNDDDFDDEDDFQNAASDPEPLEDDDEAPSGGGLFGRLKLRRKRSSGGEEDEDEEFFREAKATSERVGPEAGPVTETGATANPSFGVDDNAAAAAGGGGGPSGDNNAPNTEGTPPAPPTPVYIVDGPESQPAPDGGADAEAAPNEESSESGSGNPGLIGLDLKGIFEEAEEVDEVLKDLADSLENVAVEDLAKDLTEFLSYLQK